MVAIAAKTAVFSLGLALLVVAALVVHFAVGWTTSEPGGLRIWLHPIVDAVCSDLARVRSAVSGGVLAPPELPSGCLSVHRGVGPTYDNRLHACRIGVIGDVRCCRCSPFPPHLACPAGSPPAVTEVAA